MLKELKENTPIQTLSIPNEQGILLSVKRDDLNHPLVQGNKWRKLKYNIETYFSGDYEGILSFGGVFSNHVFSLASASAELNIPCTIYLRAHALDENNPTVQHLKNCGVKLHLLDYTQYRKKDHPDFLLEIAQKYPKYLVIPEGGSNTSGISGVKELGAQILSENDAPDYLCVPAGTGGTAIGLIQAFANTKTEIVVYSSLKGDFLKEHIAKQTEGLSFEFISEYHFGGYGKFSKELIEFINDFQSQQNILLDPVYTGKMMFGLIDMVKNEFFKDASHILALHTGGLQGVAGFNYLQGNKYGHILIS